MKSIVGISLAIFLVSFGVQASQRIPIQIKNHVSGAPITVGIPFPQGQLKSPDHVRLLDKQGNEVPCQITEVTTWAPRDLSIKWIWVFFLANQHREYELEYGTGVRKAPLTGPVIKFKNSQRTKGYAEVDTGPLKFRVTKGETGFLDLVQFDVAGDGFDDNDTIARGEHCRGSFLDILDDNGLDKSTAIVTRTVREKGSGPLHTILRVEGYYRYARTDNASSPFIIRIHTYAGKSYIRVLHTLTYTGEPDKHQPLEGQHPAIAVKMGTMLNEASSQDPGWTQPNDRIAAVGLSLDYRLAAKSNCRTTRYSGSWWDPGQAVEEVYPLAGQSTWSLVQTGPNPSRIPPLPNSSDQTRLQGFKAEIIENENIEKSFQRCEGWVDISDDRWGIAIGIKHFLEEYPKEISIDQQKSKAMAYIWSPRVDPLSFARASNDPDAGMMDNFATGLTKTTELVYHFHKSGEPLDSLRKRVNFILEPPVAHAAPQVYASSEVYGKFSPRKKEFEMYERGLEHRFDWTIFNQHWEPWYGLIDYGDQMRFYGKKEWHSWANNEPAMDFMLWMQFMRTGNPKYYRAAEAMSRHTMDVDNIHWPQAKKYYGDTNVALDYWEHQADPGETSPYLGIGRRHARQHFTSLLSAHVWVQGWLASYYLTGYHRGLEIARLSADSYVKRIWGDHGLTGRRLYLSVWNMVEVWDATKNEIYLCDLKDRVSRMLHFQSGPDQYGSLVMDRYGYSQVYASQGLYKYYQIFKDEEVAQALIGHARTVRDNPPWNHEYESYYSSIHSLLVGYELGEENSFLETAIKRAEGLKTMPLPVAFEHMKTQGEIAVALGEASNLPKNVHARLGATVWGPTQGLRIFGWTHAYNIPYLLYWMRKEQTDQ